MPTVKELKDLAKKEKIKGYSTMDKAKLCDVLLKKGLDIPDCNVRSRAKQTKNSVQKEKEKEKEKGKEAKINTGEKNMSREQYEEMKVVDLKKLASQLKIPKYSAMKKAEVIEALLNRDEPKDGVQKENKPIKKVVKRKIKSPQKDKAKSPLKEQAKSPLKEKRASPHISPRKEKAKSPLKEKEKGESDKVKPIIENIPIFNTPTPPLDLKVQKRAEKKGNCIERSHLTPRDYQIRVIEHMQRNRGLLTCHATGTGKTLIMVITAMCFLESNPHSVVIFITPVSLQGNIQKEIERYGADVNDPRLIFYTMDKFGRDYAGREKECENAFLIIDEAHNLRTTLEIDKNKKAKKDLFKNESAKNFGKNELGSDPDIVKNTRAKVIIECSIEAQKVLLLTATPVMNYPKDIINLMAMVRGEKVKTETQFNRIIANETLAKHFFKNQISFYYPDRSSDKNYPKVEKQFVNLEMSGQYYKSYLEVEQQLLPKYQEKNPFIFYTGLRIAANMIDEPSSKVAWTMNKIAEGKRIVIYSAFKAKGIRILQEEVRKLGLPYVEVTGEVDKVKRNEAVKKYNKRAVNIFFITKAGGEGLDLKETAYLVKFETSWNVNTEGQIDGRVVRYQSHTSLPEDEQKVTIYDLCSIKPALAKRDPKDSKLDSADVILKDLSEAKRVETTKFMNFILPFSIEQYKESNTQHEMKMKTLLNMPLGSGKRHSALNLYTDILVEAYLKPQVTIHSNILERYNTIVLKKQMKDLYGVQIGNQYLATHLKELSAGVGSQYRGYFFSDFYVNGMLTENVLYYLVVDISTLLSRFTLGKFEYHGLVKKGEDLYIQWKQIV